MLVTMSAFLVSMVELSNIFSVLALLICFCATILFIMRNMTMFRLNGDELMFGTSVHHIQQHIPQMKMMKVHIPFTFKLLESTKPSYSGSPTGMSFTSSGIQTAINLLDLQCVISSQVPYTLQAFWGVSIRELHLFLWRPWSVLQKEVEQGNLLQGFYQQKGAVVHKSNHGDELFTLHLPQPELDLGTPPRLCYPLVVFLIRKDSHTMHPDETVALINVIHIKDSVCTLPTSILAQYLKQANGQLSCLKQLYLATGNPLTYDDEHPTQSPAVVCTEDEVGSVWQSAGEQLCVVCQHFPLSRALLPCRHTCICASCFGKLDRCPMCRSPIRSYFCIRSEEYMPVEPGIKPSAKMAQPMRWLHDLNDRLTDFLGFQR
ncbi:cell growth regulator with RING finger domain protein 1-like isoform X2 [Schistocerca piceifrons]|uniref:cell growth regulator with RING finger domain protein 1-like isoform X2 n=1 Tax=Schistocerca piceifrons TaxID=274613 RepID=UPI001F5FD4CD|nr:cell growth regulator with RING finger domain protein 1-like isoform X2 [Schistocerca piceifrons]XP_049961246.1 cell growth regulator with RING finger domain protein 1-like isoform X2 [Schistocerca serialis cubense]